MSCRFPSDDVARRRSSGDSSGPSMANYGSGIRRGDPISRSGPAVPRPAPTVVGRSMSGRRITRPATLDDSGWCPVHQLPLITEDAVDLALHVKLSSCRWLHHCAFHQVAVMMQSMFCAVCKVGDLSVTSLCCCCAGGEYTEASYDAQSDESESWDNSKEKRRRKRY